MNTTPDSDSDLDPRRLYDALLARDARFDGVFFIGVTTTGIYCRPVCTARTPGRDRCRFFRSAREAERAGFRACFRCRPEAAPGLASVDSPSRLVAAALARLDQGFLDDHRIPALATALGVTDRHLRRAVESEVGVSLVALAQSRRLAMARRLILETQLPLTEIALSSGFGSVRRFNALFAARYRRAPSTVRRPILSGGRRSLPSLGSPRAPARSGLAKPKILSGDVARYRSLRSPAPPARSGLAKPPSARTDERGGATITLRLDFRPPFAWDALLDFLGRRAIRGVEAVTSSRDAGGTGGRTYRRSVRIGDDVGIVGLSLDLRRPSLRAEISTSLVGHVGPLVARLRRLFDLDARPDVIGDHLTRDPLLAPLVARAPGLRLPGAFDPFEVAVRAVLGQQVSVAAATTLAGRLVARFGTPLSLTDGGTPGLTHLFPPAGVLAGASVDDVAALGLPGARASTLREVARVFAESDLPQTMEAGARDEVRRRLLEIRGLGEWTASYVAMRALGDPDAFPAGDLGVRRALGDVSAAAATTRAEAWRPWRAYAAFYLWSSLPATAPVAIKPLTKPLTPREDRHASSLHAHR